MNILAEFFFQSLSDYSIFLDKVRLFTTLLRMVEVFLQYLQLSNLLNHNYVNIDLNVYTV